MAEDDSNSKSTNLMKVKIIIHQFSLFVQCQIFRFVLAFFIFFIEYPTYRTGTVLFVPETVRVVVALAKVSYSYVENRDQTGAGNSLSFAFVLCD